MFLLRENPQDKFIISCHKTIAQIHFFGGQTCWMYLNLNTVFCRLSIRPGCLVLTKMYLSPLTSTSSEKRPKISMEIHIMNTRKHLASFQFKTLVFFKAFTLFRYHIIVISSVFVVAFCFFPFISYYLSPKGRDYRLSLTVQSLFLKVEKRKIQSPTTYKSWVFLVFCMTQENESMQFTW